MSVISVFTKIPNLLLELRLALPNQVFHEIVSDSDEQLNKSEIVIGDFNLLAPHLYNLSNAKWIQGTWAGVDLLVQKMDPQKPLAYKITRFSGHSFGRLMSEYVVTSMVNHERNLFEVKRNQEKRIWGTDGKIYEHRSISDFTVAILGIGHIGNYIGKVLKLLGATVLGYGRRETLETSDETRHISGYYTKQILPDMMKCSDYVINVLPNTSETAGLLNGTMFENCAEKHSVFINIGRGGIVDENDLIQALKNNWLSAAILDVFATEPLPEDSPLWDMQQVTITPHLAGRSNPKHIAELFQNNLQLYLAGKPIPATLNTDKQY